MMNLRRLMGLPRLPIRTYLLILLLFLVLAYAIAGPVHQFFTKFRSVLSSSYEPTDEWEELLKTLKQKKQ